MPDILRRVLSGLDVTYEISGTYYERDYCVQYRESDFDFASRLMEEEGIYYFFKHADGSHQMVVTDMANPSRRSRTERMSFTRNCLVACGTDMRDHGLGKNPGTAFGRIHALGPLL